MSRILISEPNPDVRQLFEHMIRRLGHEPLALWSVTPETAATIDLVLVESADPACADLAVEARRQHPALPVVAASIFPPDVGSAIKPDAHLLKPFALGELRAVLDGLLAA
ncbi:MAG: two-component system, cell cycle response regulator CpdR [Gaiellaceae bacterium]|nr:two-component system, cell cycle response regulator CpdR [Gaiellaceae bacterium]